MEKVYRPCSPKMWELDNIIEVQVEPLVILINEDSPSSLTNLSYSE